MQEKEGREKKKRKDPWMIKVPQALRVIVLDMFHRSRWDNCRISQSNDFKKDKVHLNTETLIYKRKLVFYMYVCITHTYSTQNIKTSKYESNSPSHMTQQ